MQDRTPPDQRTLLRRTAGPYIWVSAGLGLVGTLSTINAFTLAVSLPLLG